MELGLTTSSPDRSIPIEAAEAIASLTASAISIAERRLNLADSRAETLALLIGLTRATAGLWAWGVANNEGSTIAPIAAVTQGLSPKQKTGILKMETDPEVHEEFRVPIMKIMQKERRSQSTALRTDLHDAAAWKATQMHKNYVATGFDEWVQCVNYRTPEAWASLHLVRGTGLPPFQPLDQQLVDLAMSSIPWLAATSGRTLPVEKCTSLTSRQRDVLMMQLDGFSRKQIAASLQITTDTVGDHIKKLHEHFDIRSSGELAAIFLRNR